jgi:hypothetical protein
MTLVSRVVGTLVAVAGFIAASPPAQAQESKSAPLAKQLAAALDASKLDSIAAKDPSAPDAFCAALYFANAQLLVVAAKYPVPQLLTDRVAKKEYRDTYLDLTGAALPAGKIFIQDGAADGLKAKSADNQAPDIYEASGKQTIFDGEPKKQKMSDQDYQKTFADADDRYAQILAALLAQVRKPS